jgi:hypothetical protein
MIDAGRKSLGGIIDHKNSLASFGIDTHLRTSELLRYHE